MTAQSELRLLLVDAVAEGLDEREERQRVERGTEAEHLDRVARGRHGVADDLGDACQALVRERIAVLEGCQRRDIGGRVDAAQRRQTSGVSARAVDA